MESTPAELTCSRGTRGEVNPAAQCLERHPVDALPPDPDHEPHGAWDVGSLRGLQSTGQVWPFTKPHRGMSNSC